MGSFIEVVLGGLMAGLLYSLVALGFVLIFKASGVFNFAQGAMVLLAALAFARFSEVMPMPLAFILAALVMVLVAFMIEKLVLRHLVNQEGIILFLATFGITYFIEGAGQLIFGSDIYRIDLGLPKEPKIILESTFEGGILISIEDLVAAAVAGLLVLFLALFFQKTSTGRALRAVADDHQAAQSIGIPLNRIWVIVWSVSGFVALIPVVILGGFTSVPGAILGGLIIGVGEKLAEVYLGPIIGGGIENWFAYALALMFLLFRPEGLFGERHIDRV
jgi:branched-chain amino acid transport system permease protein